MDNYLIDEDGTVRKRRALLAYYIEDRAGQKFIDSVAYREGDEPKIPAGSKLIDDAMRKNITIKARQLGRSYV